MSYTIKLQCLVCHSWFLKKKLTSKYCSVKCYHDARKGEVPWNKGKTFPYKSRPKAKGRTVWNKGKKLHYPVWNKGKKLLYPVWNKGKKTGLIPWNKGGTQTEAAKKKMSIAKKGKPFLSHRGKNHPNWKGGISPLYKKIRTSLEFKNWREKIFERDDWTCMFCKTRGGIIHPDHIKPFAIIIFENKITSFKQARDCKKLWNVENGRTLCVECHKKTDTYGFRKQYLHSKN